MTILISSSLGIESIHPSSYNTKKNSKHTSLYFPFESSGYTVVFSSKFIKSIANNGFVYVAMTTNYGSFPKIRNENDCASWQCILVKCDFWNGDHGSFFTGKTLKSAKKFGGEKSAQGLIKNTVGTFYCAAIICTQICHRGSPLNLFILFTLFTLNLVSFQSEQGEQGEQIHWRPPFIRM